MQLVTNPKIRNLAIIAHVDHGKTTLVDQMFRQSGLFRENQEISDRLMDSMDLEKERGITISAKNCSIEWKGTKINILDTPGHADFGGEVERALTMVDGAILLVDASEGPLPQTRFVLKKALENRLQVLVVVNKIDRQDARPDEVLNEVYDLFIDLEADDEQIDFPVFYAVGREGIAKPLNADSSNLELLLDGVVEHVPPPRFKEEAPFQMLVADLGYSEFLGRLAVGRVMNGQVQRNEPLVCLGEKGTKALRATKLQVYRGTTMAEVGEIEAGDILILAGVEDVHIGDTICHAESPQALPRLRIDEPTVSMRFFTNTSPLSGREGKFVQSTKLRERLLRETLRNVSLQVEDTDDAECFLVKGRGELQMSILIETMRREGFELSVGRPEVICRREGTQLLEPIEEVYIDCDEDFLGIVSEKLSLRKGRMVNLVNHGTGRIRAQFQVPSRGLIGYRSEFLTDTRGTGILNSMLLGYEPHRGALPTRLTGSLVADRSGKSVAYALFNLEPRGRLFLGPGVEVYEGMIIGEHNRNSDLNVNPCKEKKLTNVRASGKDENTVLTPVLPLTLEQAIEFIVDDEVVEVTPKSIRPRKAILNHSARQIAAKRSTP